MLARLGDPHRQLETFHVAGTNGKGSVVATLYTLLRAKGLSVGRYTSPHLVDFRERIVVDDEKIPEAQVLQFIRKWEREADRTGATFFEITTALALDWFARRKVDVAVIETGLGGRLDATNVITPVVAGITSVSIDHTDYLGETIESIAAEKGGILKTGVRGVLAPMPIEAREAIRRTAASNGAANVVEACEIFKTSDVVVTADGTGFTVETAGRSRRVATGLVGRQQADNTAVALSMLTLAGERFTLSLDEAALALARVSLPGRFQRIDGVIVDVAHNTDAVRALTTTLHEIEPERPLAVVLGVLADKDWRSMLRLLADVADRLILTNPPNAPVARRWDLEAVATAARKLAVRVAIEPELSRAIATARAQASTVVVTGSFYTVGAALEILNAAP